MQKHCVVAFPQDDFQELSTQEDVGKKCYFDYEHQSLKVDRDSNTVNRVLVVHKLYKSD